MSVAWEDDRLVPADAGPGLVLDAFDEWRIGERIPRFGVDLDEDSLPQEAGGERFIDFTKGCFMGQEAMARIRNFEGHPTRVVRALRAEGAVAPGEFVTADGDEAGVVTSATGTDAIARVTWRARAADLRSASGARLSDRA
jgi:folate-binding protein YgfZ